MKFNIINPIIILILGLMVINSCQPEEEYEKTRLFSPVLRKALEAENNTIILDLGQMKGVVSYTIEMSLDTFNTVLYTFDIDTNYVIVDESLTGEELLWNTKYWFRATAHADDPQYDSKTAELGEVRTEKYPSNMTAPTEFDMLDTRIKVKWTKVGNPITSVKLYSLEDLRHVTPILEFDVTAEEQDAGEIILTGLTPSTSYQVALFSGTEIRGWEIYTTKAAAVSGDNVIDLAGIDNPYILYDTLDDLADGSIILLEGGRTYYTAPADSFYFISKAITIRAGLGFTEGYPTIKCDRNYEIKNGSTVDSIIFIDVAFEGDFAANYVLNCSQSGTVGEIRFENCKIHSLRGIVRFKGGTGTLGKYSIINSRADSINGYSVLTVDVPEWSVGDILLKNSTFSKCQYFLVSRSNSNSVTIESCTISEAPENGRQMFRWRGGAGNDNVTNGITINNTIWGHGWDMTGGGVLAVKGMEGLASTNFIIVNTYATSQFSFSTDPIPGFPANVYSGTAEDLWKDPYEGTDFTIIDNNFGGKDNSGDPRWRPF